MKTPCQLRPATNFDPVTLAQLDKIASADPWSALQYESSLKAGHTVWIATQEEGAIVWMQGSKEAEILQIFVMPCFRRKGIGRFLIKEMLKEARRKGASEVFLEVRQSNQNALALYQSLGFTIYGVRKNYYALENGFENALLMKKNQ